MFLPNFSGIVSELTPNNQTRFQCTVTLTLPLEEIASIEPGRLIATENVLSATREKRYTVLQILGVFPATGESKRGTTLLACTATPIGQELRIKGTRKEREIVTADTFPAFGGTVEVLDDDTTREIIHQIAPDSRVEVNGSRIDIGNYRSNPNVNVGMDAATLLRGNAAVISARPRARTSMTTSLIQALLQDAEHPVHIVYCDVNNMGTMSLAPILSQFPHSSVLCLNDKFVPASVFSAMKNPGDRSAHKRAVLDYLDMMILPSVIENRRHDFSSAVSTWMRENRVAIFRPNEQTVDAFINDIRVDILDGVDEDVEEYISELMNGMAETYRGERFTEKNTRDMLDMVEEFSQESKSHSARRTLYDLKAEIQSVFETYSKDIPTAVRRSMPEVISELNNDEKSSLLVVQGQKPTDIMRFVGTLAQTLIEERLKRLKIRTPVLFIFNNIDEYVGRSATAARESSSDRFFDVLQTLLINGRRHGLGFCLTLESAASLDRSLARRIQSYFIGPITFVEEPARIADLLNMSEDLLRPAVHYEDGEFLFASADSPYHRRVPLPVTTRKNTAVIHTWLDELLVEYERRRQEYMAQEEERRRRQDQEREDRRRAAEKAAAEKAILEKIAAERAAREKAAAGTTPPDEAQQAEDVSDEKTESAGETARTSSSDKSKGRTTRDRRKRSGRHGHEDENDSEANDDETSDERDAANDRSFEAIDSEDPSMFDDTEMGDEELAAADSGTTESDPPATAAPPARKSTRGRRGRGKSGRQPGASDAPTPAAKPAPQSPAPPPTPEKQPSTSPTRNLTIEEFDPNAGKSAPTERTPSASHAGDDAPEAANSAAADPDAASDAKKKPGRRPPRRRGTRSK
ncbi:MAG: hypothetical protein RBU27_00400 [Bacteroidota bacterium]|jgi:hypothetical protein|nr:hypothetical protein [Bacteroidota bacterium]